MLRVLHRSGGPAVNRVVVLLCLLLSAGCGSSSPAPSAGGPTPTGTPTVSAAPAWTPDPVPSFGTPEAAMRYLADAWNRLDLEALMHVTDPSAREELNAMHREATDLRLHRCLRQEAGDYLCTFTHGFPPGYQHRGTVGTAGFRVGPVRRSGWYMTVYEYCGDGAGG